MRGSILETGSKPDPVELDPDQRAAAKARVEAWLASEHEHGQTLEVLGDTFVCTD